ncbi:MAG: M20/M25/M40 family metallo-hydrolase [Thermoflexales bacterium]|nr:M20/M25/M40 family metallo-hydrolase [Thermoflexales bacterium]
MDFRQHTEETTRLLQDLLRFDTTNPPGNETPCIDFIARTLARDGFESTVIESAPGRGNLVTRLKGDGSLPPILIFGHVDVVPAEANRWQRPPFSGDLHDGVLWGRGAVDMKNMVAMEMMTMALLKRAGGTLRRDVIFMANADEEVGGVFGAKFMVEQHPDLIRAEYGITEGGAAGLELDGKSFFVCSTGEKGMARFTVRGHGKPGHASQPHMDNPILPLAIALQKLIQKPLPLHVTRTVRAQIDALSAEVGGELGRMLQALLDPATHDDAMAELPLSDAFKRRLNATLRNTATPTILQAGTKINVIPGEAAAQVDCRVLPGTTPESIAAEVRAVVGDAVEIEFGRFTAGQEFDPASPLLDVIRQSVREHVPGGIVIPGLIAGGTDARHTSKIGIKTYGFVPTRYEGPTMVGLAHNHDERISVNNLMFGTQVLHDVVAKFAR